VKIKMNQQVNQQVNQIRSRIDKKPSVVLRAMLFGIEQYSQSSDFVFDTSTFGSVDSVDSDRVCIGCAATCAIWHMFEKQEINFLDLDEESFPFYVDERFPVSRRLISDTNAGYLSDLEDAIDVARRGSLTISELFCFLGIDEPRADKILLGFSDFDLTELELLGRIEDFYRVKQKWEVFINYLESQGV
jgi:hypothetical protein